MRSLVIRLLALSFLLIPSSLFAHSVTISGTQNFSSLDGSASDHDGVVNGVFTVSDGDLTFNGAVNCNDDSSTSACAMAFNVSGNLTMNGGGALFAENRTGSGNGAAIALTVGGNLTMNGNAIISSASKTTAGGTGGAITANVGGSVALASGTNIDSGSGGAKAGDITIAAGGLVSLNGNVLAGPGRTLLATRFTGDILSGGNANQIGGKIAIGSSGFAEPALTVGATATIASQGEKDGAGPVTLDGCGIQIRGLVAAVSHKESAATVAIRSGKNLLIDGRDLDATGTRLGRVRADAMQDGANNDGVDLFATGSITVLGPAAAGTTFAVSSTPGAKGNKDSGGTIRVVALEDTASASGRAFIAGADGKGTRGGTISIDAKHDVNLDTATLSSTGDITKPKKDSAGGHITARSYSDNVLWRNGTGDVRPVGSTSGIPLADQGTIVLTACGTVDTTGSSFPVNGVATSMHPQTATGVCSPSAPSLPAGVAPLITCNTPPVANDAAASTNEDTTVTINLSGSDADGDSLTFSIVSGPSNGSLGAIVPTGPTTATVDYTPNLNFNGGDSFVYRANDGNGGTDDATVTITVVAVNDPPSFLAGPTVTVLEDAGPQTYANWATSISPGPADESGQSVTFTVTNDNPSLFSVQPALASNGTLTFTPAANRNGSANITVVAHDNGGIANGGNDTSATQTSSITVTAVNDEPSFLAGPDQTVNEDAGPQTVLNWATAISAGPNEAGQTLTFVVSNDNNGLFSAQPAISPSGTLTYTPAANANGTATVSVYLQDDGGTANGGDDTSPTVTFTITVNPVNDAPSFVSGGDVTVNEDSGAYLAPWATSVSAGPANESGQTLAFSVTGNSNPSLFASGPSVAPDGTLSFTLAANTSGSASITVVLQDNGGTANGGVDTSASVAFTITVNSINDAPSFTGGGNVTVNEDSGLYSAAWATAISAGPNEGGQTVQFFVSNDNPSLFSVAPSISPTGVLTFTPAANAFGFATVSVYLQDNGGTANGGVDTSATQTFVITVNSVNDAPTVVGEAYDTVGNTLLQVAASQTQSPAVFVSGNLLSNDSDSDGPGALTASFVSATPGAVVTVNPDGTFTYVPPPGLGGSDSFTYAVSDGATSVNGTVTITIKDRVWYVKNDGGGSAGTSSDPFSTLTAAQTSSSPGDTIYVFTGDGTTNNQNAGYVFKSNQRLLGAGVALTVPVSVNGGPNPTTLAAAGTRPHIGNSAAIGVQATNNGSIEVAGLDISANTHGISASVTVANTGATNLHDLGVVAAGMRGILIGGGGTYTVTIDDVTVVSTDNGLDARGAMHIAVNGSTFASSAANGVDIEQSGAGQPVVTSFSNDTVSGNTAGDGVVFDGVLFDAIPGGALNAVSGGALSIGSAGNGVGGSGLVVSASSGHLSFASLSVVAAGAAGVDVAGTGAFTGAAGTQLSSATGTIAATAGSALRVSNATLGTTLAAIASSNAATSGIALSGVNGSASIAGGSITDSTGADISISGSNANISYGGTVTDDLGTVVSMSGNTGGSYTFSGAITDGNDGDGNGVTLTSNTGAAIAFTGGVVLSTGANPAFTATGGGTVTVTGSTSTLTTTDATALNVTNTGIGAAGMTFRSIDVDGNDSAPANGIVLSNTGALGGLTVSGTGGAGTGGTIRDTSGDGILLSNTQAVSLSSMNVTSNLGAGVRGNTVNGFVVNGSTITQNGDSAATDESGIEISQLSGSAIGGTRPTAINNSTVSNNFEFEVQITNTSGTLTDFQINNSNISSNGASGVHGNLVNFLALGTASMTLNVTGGSYTGNAPTTATAIHADASGGSVTANVSGATLTNNNVGVNASAALNGNVVFDVHDNTLTGSRSHALNFFLAANSTGTAAGKFRNNVIGTLGSAGSGSVIGFGVRIQNDAINNANILVDNNTIQELAGFAAVNVNVGIVGSPLALATNVTITNNIIRNVNARAIIVQHVLGKGTICADIAGNNMSGIAGAAGDGSKIRIRQLPGGTFNVKQKAATAAADPLELDDVNSVGANVTTPAQVSAAGTFNYNSGGCPQP